MRSRGWNSQLAKGSWYHSMKGKHQGWHNSKWRGRCSCQRGMPVEHMPQRHPLLWTTCDIIFFWEMTGGGGDRAKDLEHRSQDTWASFIERHTRVIISKYSAKTLVAWKQWAHEYWVWRSHSFVRVKRHLNNRWWIHRRSGLVIFQCLWQDTMTKVSYRRQSYWGS